MRKKIEEQKQKSNMIKTKLIYIIVLIIAFVLIDQLTKFLAPGIVNSLNDDSLIELNISENSNDIGMSVMISILVIGLAINFIYHQIDKMEKSASTAVSMIIAGCIGNLIDRVFKGGIINILKLGNGFYFNLASLYIVVGWILIIFSMMIFSSMNDLQFKKAIEAQDEELATGKNSKVKVKRK